MVNIVKNHINYRRKVYSINSKYKLFKGKKFIMIGTPNHKNIGDQAIAYAQYKYFKDNFNGYGIIDVNMEEYHKNKNILLKHVNDEDIIILQGGGNFGNEYMYDENIRRNAIETFKNNKIILFPQTMFFTNDNNGKKELEISRKVYNAHNNLVLIAREKSSYELMRELFKNNKVIITPDIVMYLNYNNVNLARKNALLCLRDDVEKALDTQHEKKIEEMLKSNYNCINRTDMKSKINVKGKERKMVIIEKIKQFSKYEIVITDRLHGMIFAAITGTPCIALSNYNYKVKGTYEWIKDLGYIKFTDDINEIPDLIQELKNIKNVKYDNLFAIKKYDQIIQCINS